MKTKNIKLAALSALLTLTTSTPSVMAAGQCRTEDVRLLMPENGSPASGRAVLVVNNGGAHVLIHAEKLTPGVAYTVWFVYFDDTSRCLIPHQCADADLTMPVSDPQGVFGRMDSAIAGDNGELTFQATLRDFRISAGSAVLLALFEHGPASTTDNQERARQLLTPQAPGLGAPGLGVGTQKGFLVGAATFDIGSCK